MSNVELLVLTRDQPRHIFFADKLTESFRSSKVIIEKSPSPTNLGKDLKEFQVVEKSFFPDSHKLQGNLDERIAKVIENGEINEPEVINFMTNMDPYFLAVFGTSILKNPLIESFPHHRILNFHAGLSPYYRGVVSNLWAIHNEEPEYIGVTIHYLDTGIDTGNIIVQGRPILEEADTTHTIGCKCVTLGTDLMISTIKKYKREGSLISTIQDHTKGHLYKKRDFTEKVSEEIKMKIEGGVIQKYLDNPKEVDIITW
jgi:methionyl-tRNA formyltransferase